MRGSIDVYDDDKEDEFEFDEPLTDLNDLRVDQEYLAGRIAAGRIDASSAALRHHVLTALPAIITELEKLRGGLVDEKTPVITKSDYQVMTYDGMLADEPSGGWMPVSSVTDDPQDATARMRARRARNALTSPLAVWRRDITWSVHATEDGPVANDR